MGRIIFFYDVKIFLFAAIIPIFILGLFSLPSYAGPVICIDADKQFNFAEYYFSQAQYFKAIAEYERFIYYFPEDRRAEQARYKIGMSYFKSKHFKEAINAFNSIIDASGDTGLSVSESYSNTYLMISECYMNLGESGIAITTLHNLIMFTPQQNVKDEAYYRIGWIYLQMASWEKARFFLSKISPENKNKYRLDKLSKELDTVQSIPFKNPKIAGGLSIIPGAGYLYCQRYQDALVAFLLNAGLIYAAYESFDTDHNALGGLITFVGFGFYAGNIYGSIAGAHKYNRRNTLNFIDQIKEKVRFNLSTHPGKNDVLFSFNYCF
ncbi:MAG: tetratricopeptide repeat protein [Desulfobacterales bacterium]|nr:tetratricopeptide repeat protein [Desulfobacterales bacterium]